MLDPATIYKDLKDRLYELDEMRERFADKVDPFKYSFWSILILGATFLIVRLNIPSLHDAIINDDQVGTFIILYGVLSVLTLIAYLISHHYNRNKFKVLFLDEIAPRIIRGLGPSFTYDYEGQIPLEKISGSLLFAPFDNYYCQDLVNGKIGETSIEFAEIKLVKKHPGDQNKSSTTIFDGILFIADLQVEFPTAIWLVPRKHATTLSRSDKQKLKLNHPAFKGFSAYTNDADIASKILKSFILDQIGRLNQKLKSRIAYGKCGYYFIGNEVYMSIPTFRKFLEPKLNRSIDSLKFIQDQTTLLNTIYELLDDLTLK